MMLHNIPEELKRMSIWCVWRYENGGKIPYNLSTGYKAKSNTINTFTTYQTVCKALNSGSYDGIGIGIFNGVSAIDIDHCVDNGIISEMAKDIIQKMNSYTEISPSGTGIRILFSVTNFQYDKEKYYIHNRNIGLEIYVSGATSKFVTVTGERINDNAFQDGSVALIEILTLYMERPLSVPSQSCLNNDVFAGDFFKIGLEKDKKLIAYWNGERPCESESENDFGFMAKLLYWTNKDIDAAIQAFLSSPYTQQKDAEHLRKLERKDYLMNTAKSAMPSTTAAENQKKWEAEHKTSKVNSEQQTKKQPELSLISASELQKKTFPPMHFFVDNLLPEGTNLLSASPKIGKSWFVLDMGLQIAAGKPFLGKNTTQAGVLYLAFEDTERRLKDRINKILMGETPPECFYCSTKPITLDDGLLKYLESTLESHPEIKLIIIDTFQKIRGQAGSREGAYQYDYREMGIVKEFMDKHGKSVLFVHHNRKMVDKEDSFNMISGTNGIGGAADTAFVITKTSRSSKDAILHITGRDVESSELTMNFDRNTCRWNLIGNTEEIAEQNRRTEYYKNLVVIAIRSVVQQSTLKEWFGTASELIQANPNLSKFSPQKIGYEINSLEKQLLKYDSIVYSYKTNGNSGRRHCFRCLPYDECVTQEYNSEETT